ncbi:ABC-2 transporter permease [Lysobacter sp. A03]|uniref:ABC-2 transporter permease n=1 Tax=Lysobacter sp. A03 TaxID=1199154 RepID=UPI0005B6A438|nr:ABC-2 transporter permease [Lysobacter sp. A03]KIQ95936.1 putative ABC transporter, permease protein [Lysobacter sp. A03]
MNATDTSLPTSSRTFAPVHPTHTFKMLLKREYWEHKGGFLWAPLIAGAISLLLTLMAFIVAEVAARRAISSGELKIGGEVMVNGLDLGALTGKLDAGQMQQLAQGIDLSLLMAALWPFVVLAFVVFFYCLGSLYDDRKDRSVLFWKSLPISDTQTVLSKVVSATLIAPTLAVAMALATMVGFMLLLSAMVMAHGGNPIELLWGPANPMALAASLLAAIPVFALWSLPTVGWLMLCSAWARTKPFLWALMVPLFAGIIVSWFQLMKMFDLDASWFWSNVVGRMLLGTVPASELPYRQSAAQGSDGVKDLLAHMSASNVLSSLAMPSLWIGVAAGALMIFLAIRLRRWRDEG